MGYTRSHAPGDHVRPMRHRSMNGEPIRNKGGNRMESEASRHGSAGWLVCHPRAGGMPCQGRRQWSTAWGVAHVRAGCPDRHHACRGGRRCCPRAGGMPPASPLTARHRIVLPTCVWDALSGAVYDLSLRCCSRAQRRHDLV